MGHSFTPTADLGIEVWVEKELVGFFKHYPNKRDRVLVVTQMDDPTIDDMGFAKFSERIFPYQSRTISITKKQIYFGTFPPEAAEIPRFAEVYEDRACDAMCYQFKILKISVSEHEWLFDHPQFDPI